MTETQEPRLAKIGKYWERDDFIGVFQYSYLIPRFFSYEEKQIRVPLPLIEVAKIINQY